MGFQQETKRQTRFAQFQGLCLWVYGDSESFVVSRWYGGQAILGAAAEDPEEEARRPRVSAHTAAFAHGVDGRHPFHHLRNPEMMIPPVNANERWFLMVS